MLPTFIPRKPFRHRARAASAAGPTPPPAALVLVSASFDLEGQGGPTVTLAFDRPIDVSGLDPSQVTVDDAPGAGWRYVGTGVASLPGPATVVISLIEDGSAEGPTVLNATAATGIVADDDGGTWAGVVGLELPYP